MGKIKDLTGQRFGRLQVVSHQGSNKFQKAIWLCQCDCGNTKVVIGSKLLIGETQSCGCYGIERRTEATKKSNTKHGHKNTNLYDLWHNMKLRCYDKNQPNYKNYGGRGITVCNAWKDDFMSFHDWAKNNGYTGIKGDNGINILTLDRIDVNGNYCPENCRWITTQEQANNRRSNRLFTYNNETKTISQWATHFNISKKLVYNRLHNGWECLRALTTPLQIKRRAV